LQRKELTALAGLPVAVGLAEVVVLEGVAEGFADDDGLVPLDAPSAMILAAACSAMATM